MRKLRGKWSAKWPEWWGLELLLLLDANRTRTISPLLLLHVYSQYSTPVLGILPNHRFCLCGQVRKEYFGLTGLLVLERLLQIMFAAPCKFFPQFKCRQPCKTVPMTEPLTVTQNMLSVISVGCFVLYKAEQGTYALCPWAGSSSSVNPVSLSGSSDVL